MAYTIISQNNSTTTLSDGVNTITVPSRVNLTSGNFTIVEVNNNMATLEDGDGNVYRDIPCVATLAGEGGGGGSSLPDQTGQSGKFLTTDGTDASWSNKPLVNTATGTEGWGIGGISSGLRASGVAGARAYGPESVALGVYAQTESTAMYSTSLGKNSKVGSNANFGIAIGWGTQIGNNAVHAMQFGSVTNSYQTNSDANTVKFANANGNFEIMSADGTIPTARLTKVNSTITLAAAGWSGGSQTVTVSGVTSTSIVWVSPDPTDQSAYVAAGVLCSAQGTNSLTFTATTTPSADIDVVVVAM